MKREHIDMLLLEERKRFFTGKVSLSGVRCFLLAVVLLVMVGGCMAWSSPSLVRAFILPPARISGPFDFGNQALMLDHEMLRFRHGIYRSPDGQRVAYFVDQRVNRPLTRSAAILIDNPSGSGIFFYVVGAARTDGDTKYSTPVFLGDRIRVETVSVGERTVTIHYLKHAATAPLAAPPTEPVTVRYTIQKNGNLRVAP